MALLWAERKRLDHAQARSARCARGLSAMRQHRTVGAMVQLRRATLDDFDAVLIRTRALNAQEGIEIAGPMLEAGLRRLLSDHALGRCWLIEHRGAAIGHAIVTFGFDLEFGGRDACLTELWIDPAERGQGAGTTVLALLDDELRTEDVRALHLGVRPDNPTIRLYERAGFVPSRHRFMTRRLS
jgi:ribosomal protein S18 acetylase RimI-like enzyme